MGRVFVYAKFIARSCLGEEGQVIASKCPTFLSRGTLATMTKYKYYIFMTHVIWMKTIL
jgi:hypothetical protein